MYRLLKVLAILVLVITIAGAGAVLYGINMLVPQVEMTGVLATPAAQAQEIYDGVMTQLDSGTFTGRVFAQTQGLYAQDCTFLTYTVRLANKGFFPAEWIALEIEPRQEAAFTDVLQLDNNGANVLAAGSTGDLAATVLVSGDASDVQRAFTVTCYVLGKQIRFEGNAQ